MEFKTAVICPPDLSSRPLGLKIEKRIALPADILHKAWTNQLDLWLASPASFLGKAEVNAPFYFETMHDGIRYPHYGRFLSMEEDKIAMTWVSGENGTKGTETVLTIEFAEHEDGTFVSLCHAGFPDEETRDKHQESWPAILQQMEERMSRPVD